jgi:hypothetical protein
LLKNYVVLRPAQPEIAHGSHFNTECCGQPGR